MSIEPDRDQFFQYATFAVVGLTLVVCLCYGLIFLNPRANLLSAMQPVTPTVRVSVISLPPTWTPTATDSPTPTPTDTPTNTPTDTPTNTPPLTDTPVPSSTSTSVPVPPTPTRPRIVYVPPTPLPPPPPTTASPRLSFVQIKHQASPNCGTWSLQGTVWENGYGNGFVPGTRVRVWINGGGIKDAIAGATGKNNPGYWEIIFPQHTAGSGQIGIVDDNGNLLTPQQYPVKLTSSCTGTGAANQIIVDFSAVN